MNIIDYHSSGGKNQILEFIDNLPPDERLLLYDVRKEVRIKGVGIADSVHFQTRQLYKKIWEIKIFCFRIMYIIVDSENIVFLHICKKQKGKTEKQKLKKAIRRAREGNFI